MKLKEIRLVENFWLQVRVGEPFEFFGRTMKIKAQNEKCILWEGGREEQGQTRYQDGFCYLLCMLDDDRAWCGDTCHCENPIIDAKLICRECGYGELSFMQESAISLAEKEKFERQEVTKTVESMKKECGAEKMDVNVDINNKRFICNVPYQVVHKQYRCTKEQFNFIIAKSRQLLGFPVKSLGVYDAEAIKTLMAKFPKFQFVLKGDKEVKVQENQTFGSLGLDAVTLADL